MGWIAMLRSEFPLCQLSTGDSMLLTTEPGHKGQSLAFRGMKEPDVQLLLRVDGEKDALSFFSRELTLQTRCLEYVVSSDL